MRNPFATRTREEATRDALLRADTRKELRSLEQLGKNLMGDARYTKYRESMELALGKVIRDLLEYDNADNNIYAVNVRTTLQRIKDFVAFLNTPKSWLNYVEIQRMAKKE